MNQQQADALAALLPPLFRALETLLVIARHFHPPRFGELMREIGTPELELEQAQDQHLSLLSEFASLQSAIGTACNEAREAYSKLREVLENGGDAHAVYTAFRHVSRGFEALYPLASVLPPVSRFFLDPASRNNQALLQQLSEPASEEKTGIMRFATTDEKSQGERGGFWLYVPENYAASRPRPLVVALHGGSGTGRQFLWTWLRDARSHGTILVAPSSMASTWSLLSDDIDTPNLHRIVEFVKTNWSIDDKRMLLTGMSDGGTFTYLSGLNPESPFTHLAPVSAAFHPLLTALFEQPRIEGLPVYIVHGALDWMFPVSMAREAEHALQSAKANVTYDEIENLSHTYPREVNARLLSWLLKKIFT